MTTLKETVLFGVLLVLIILPFISTQSSHAELQSVFSIMAIEITPSYVKITWDAPSDGESIITLYEIQRLDKIFSNDTTDLGEFETLAIVNGSTTEYTDMNVVSGKAYQYKIQSNNTLGNVVSSNTIPVNVPNTTPNITAPANAILEATGIDTTITIIQTLTTSQIGTANATDAVDPNSTITNNATLILPLGNSTILWTVTDSAGNSHEDMQTITIQDTTAPALVIPANKTLEATGITTTLPPSQIGTANATDAVDPNPAITNNATLTSFPVGTTVINYTATDTYGNSASALQKIVIQDTTPPVIDVSSMINVTATGVLTWANLTASVSDTVDTMPVLTHDSPKYLPLGSTNVTWTATDTYGNRATTSSVVHVIGSDSLDTDWHYKLIETKRNYLPHSAVSASKTPTNPTAVHLATSDVNHGTMHFFKSFAKDDITSGYITLNLELGSKPFVDVYLMDGKYSATASSDFVSTDPVSKGGGKIASYTHMYAPNTNAPSDITVQLFNNLTKSQMNDVTLFIDTARPPHGQNLHIYSIEVENHSKWIFNDYKVYQKPGYGTFSLVPPTKEALRINPLPINDTFDSSFDGWTYWGDIGDYTMKLDNTTGRKSIHVTADGFSIEAGIAKRIDVSGLDEDSQRLVISADYKASSTYSGSTNSRILLFDSDSGNLLKISSLVAGGTTDTGWQTYKEDITDHVADSKAVQIVFHLYDVWSASWDQKNWYDDIMVYTVNQTEKIPTTNTRTAQAFGMAGGFEGEGISANATLINGYSTCGVLCE